MSEEIKIIISNSDGQADIYPENFFEFLADLASAFSKLKQINLKSI